MTQRNCTMVVVLILFMLLFACSDSDGSSRVKNADYESGFNLLKEGKNEAAFKVLMPLAESGNAAAQCLIGLMYYDGLYVEKDYESSIKWLQRSVDSDYPEGKHNLAAIFIDKNKYEEAKDLLESAIDDGYTYSLHYLGLIYFNGWGVPVNYCKAKEIFEISIQHNNNKSYYPLSKMLIEGLCGETDLELGFRYAFKSANVNDPEGQALMGAFYEYGVVVERNCWEAISWYQRALNTGHGGIKGRLDELRKTCK